jgi:hypothetical protein
LVRVSAKITTTFSPEVLGATARAVITKSAAENAYPFNLLLVLAGLLLERLAPQPKARPRGRSDGGGADVLPFVRRNASMRTDRRALLRV